MKVLEFKEADGQNLDLPTTQLIALGVEHAGLEEGAELEMDGLFQVYTAISQRQVDIEATMCALAVMQSNGNPQETALRYIDSVREAMSA